MGLIGCGGDGACDSTPNVDPFPWLLQPPLAPPSLGGVPPCSRSCARPVCVSKRMLLDAVALAAVVWLIAELV